MGKMDLQRITECAADFFVTGAGYVRDSLNLKFIPCGRADKIAYAGGLILDLKFIPYDSEDIHGGGVILADVNQDLLQSYSIAKNVFEQVKSGKIKFVLIGLSPYILPQNDSEPLVAWDVKTNALVLEDYFKLCLDNGAKPVVVVLPVHSSLKKNYNADVLKTFRDTINQVVKKFQSSAFIDLLDVTLSNVCFQDKTHLNSEGAKAVTVFLSSRLYLKGILYPKDLCAADDEFFNVFAKYFPRDRNNFPNDDKPLISLVFCILACEDFNRLSKTMPREDCLDLMARVFSELTYSYLANLADVLPKDDFNELMNRIFKITVENIRRKDKIKVGFYFEFSAHWCGDDLYNLFAQDKRFEPVIFMPIDSSNEFTRKDFLKDAKKFKDRGLNVLEMEKNSLDVPTQDILFRFRPYPEFILPAFRLTNIKVKETLLANFPYSFGLGGALYNYANYPLHIVSWKMFWTSIVWLEKFKRTSKINTPRGIYSGYPKLDVFFKHDSKFNFDWKMARPDAKKIIWAPHWSMNTSWGGYSTFHWNYKFMYEFAKAHPEISWVVKPHPLLAQQAIGIRLFPSNEALDEYFQKWDDLPNARFYTGTYYNDIFATSDGMIHDSCSFIAEYQYVDKPMIFLSPKVIGSFNELGKEILNASYLVDGKDFDAVAAMIQRVFIEGDDYKAAERKAVFDKHLNYQKHNGMLASEFIYKNIIEELG